MTCHLGELAVTVEGSPVQRRHPTLRVPAVYRAAVVNQQCGDGDSRTRFVAACCCPLRSLARGSEDKQRTELWSQQEVERENLRISMRIDLEVSSSFDLIITTSTSDSEYVRV